jgi:alkyldihydroxyacetonephosphate synthase
MSNASPANASPDHASPADQSSLGPARPTAPITLGGAVAHGGPAGSRWDLPAVAISAEVLDALRSAVDQRVTTEPAVIAEASRDWWPLAMTWAADGQVAAVAGAVVQPASAEQVSAVLAICNTAGIPVTAAGGRSGVCGASVPVFGGVVLDMCAMTGIVSVDTESMVVDVAPGTFGDHFEHELSTHGVTVGHWPQSMALSTVGGWLACRGAGQMSNRYGKIEDMVIGLDVVLADGTMVHTGGNARQASGPDLNQLFVGSEGTLGIITGARLRLHRLATHRATSAWGFSSFAEGLDACRRIVQRGATPAVLRLYDDIEANRSYGTGNHHVLLVLDEGDELLTSATMAIVDAECAAAQRLDDALVDQWMGHRNDVAALESLISKGFVVDTMEVTAPWARLDEVYRSVTGAIAAVDGTLAASAHQSHAYPDGACLYVTFAGRVDADQRDSYYRAVWDAGTTAALGLGGSLSHHHGVGLNRGRFMRQALGAGFDVLASMKQALDPNGILNPGKLGLDSPFGPAPFAGTVQ